MRLFDARRRWKRYAAVGIGLLAVAGGVHARQARRRPRFRYDGRYREEIVLPDGTRVLLRLVRPGDKRLLAAGMKRLSSEGRYRRFHVPKHDLTRSELKYFTEMDTLNHFAIGALRRGGGREGLGIARFVRLPDKPDTAEIAIAVADEAQGRGLGRALLARLAEAARERGVRTFTCDVLATNKPFFRALSAVFPEQSRRQGGPYVTISVRLSDLPIR